jgi:DNA invertase Pin-like site-specific DNA recombinase
VAHLLGYARVSTALQDEGLQLDALDAAGCVRVYTDRVSRRPERRRGGWIGCWSGPMRGDAVVVWRLDRLGRSLRELIDIVTSGGRLLFRIFGSIAEFERGLIHEHTMAGVAAARAHGRKGGRPAVMTAQKLTVARRMYETPSTAGAPTPSRRSPPPSASARRYLPPSRQ